MSKRATVKGNNITQRGRNERDYYPTPIEAVAPLIPHLPETGVFMEPCAGDGRLARHIEQLTEMQVWARGLLDIEPQHPSVTRFDALTLSPWHMIGVDFLVTNPPFAWDTLKPMIETFVDLKPTFLLLPFSYACNKRMAIYMERCRKVIPIGRVKWIEGSKQTSTDDFAWFMFDGEMRGYTKLYPRV